jgi:hypothetical protein
LWGVYPPPKIPKIIKKGMLGLDLIWIRSGSGLDQVWTWLRRLRVKSEGPAIGRVCLVLLTDLIIRDGGKLLCQLLKRIMWFSWCWLGGIWGIEGLDTRICLDYLGYKTE